MAELILTDEEKAAALWSDLDDAALGKLVKKKIALLTDASEQLDRVTTFAAAMLLCCEAAKLNAHEVALEIEGLAEAGQEFGDWKVVAMKVRAAESKINREVVTSCEPVGRIGYADLMRLAKEAGLGPENVSGLLQARLELFGRAVERTARAAEQERCSSVGDAPELKGAPPAA